MTKRVGSLIFIIVSVGIASSISLIGGLGIEAVQEKLLTIVPLVIALPSLNSMMGDYATLIAAHAGDPEERTRSKMELVRAMAPSIVLNIIFVISISLVLSARRSYDITPLFFAQFAGFVAFSILSVVSIMFIITLALDAALKKRPLNPDDVLIPIVTSISDVFMLGLIALAAWFVF